MRRDARNSKQLKEDFNSGAAASSVRDVMQKNATQHKELDWNEIAMGDPKVGQSH